jgi:streptomycin 6-kinase
MVPETVQRKALAVGAAAWLDALPGLVAELSREWSITVGAAYQDATEAYVARATLDGGTPAVLKLCVPRPGDHAANEITVLRLAGGAGCVRLLRNDVRRGALLLERLGTPLSELGLPVRQRHEILCAAASQLWRPAPDCGLPTGAAKGRWLIDQITASWERLDRPCAERTVAHAVATAERRIAAHDDERAVLVHGDVHQWNTLRVSDSATGGGTAPYETAPYKLVDPDGLLAEAEYDMGIVMREDAVELMRGDPYDRARWLAARTGLDPVAIWEWGVVERVSTGLLCVEVGLQPFGRNMLAAADHIAE